MRTIFVLLILLTAFVPTYAHGRGNSAFGRMPLLERDSTKKDGVGKTPKKDTTTDDTVFIEFIKPVLFSDFVGFDGTQPNGLLQTEIDLSVRLFNLPLIKDCLYFNRNVLSFVRLSRLNNKVQPLALRVDTVNKIDGETVKYAHIIDLLQYAHISTGGKLNILYWHYKAKGIKLYADWEFRLYSTTLSYERDVTVNGKPQSRKDDYGGLVFGHGPAVKISVTPENFKGKIQADFSVVWLINANLYDDDFKADFGPRSRIPEGAKYGTFNGNSGRRGVWVPQFDFIWKPDHKGNSQENSEMQGTNEFFFRTTITVGNSVNRNFFQVQVGYTRALKFQHTPSKPKQTP